MPASITTDLVVSSPKVAGKRMLMPESGPMPGSTPTIVPTRQPRKAYHSTSGCSATENPSSRLSSVPIALESEQSERAVLERRLEQHGEQQPGERNHADAEGGGGQRVAALGAEDQREQHQRHGDEKAERLVERDGGGGD